MSILSKYFPSPSVFFKYTDKNPYVAYQGEEIKLPLSEELRGLDILSFEGKKDFMIKIDSDETQLTLTNIVDGGEF